MLSGPVRETRVPCLPMRTFIAIDLPDALRLSLAEAQQSFRSVCPEARWTRPEGIHLTLKFLGEVTDSQLRQVVEALHGMGPLDAFPIELKGFGFFPNARRPRVFWVGVEAPPALMDLAERVERVMEKVGFMREERPFAPHLTLARFTVPRAQPALEGALASRQPASLGRFEAAEFFLFESKLSPQGAQYRKVSRFP